MSALWLTRVTDEPGLRRWHSAFASGGEVDFVALPIDPLVDYLPGLTGPVQGSNVEFWTGTEGDEVVAAVILHLSIHDNLTVAQVGGRVPPQHRRRGYGRRALDDALVIAGDRGRERVLLEVPTRTREFEPSPGELLARAGGGRAMLAETRRMLDLASLPAGRLDDLAVAAEKAAAGYSTIEWVDHTPEPLIAEMAHLRALMSTDPPQGDLELEPEEWDSARYLDNERSVVERGRQVIVTAVREDATGRLAGYTNIGTRRDATEVGFQWDTIVESTHRGHRLGMVLKVANLRHLMRVRPGLRYVNTWNADSNAHMVGVNVQLGFVPMEGWSEWQIDL